MRAAPPTRAVAFLSPGHCAIWANSGHDYGMSLADVCQSIVDCGSSQVWLACHSGDWGALVPLFARAGWQVEPKLSCGHIGGIRLLKDGRQIIGRDAGDLAPLDLADDYLPIDMARDTWRRLDSLDRFTRERFGVALSVSAASTAIEILRGYLDRPLGLNAGTAVRLRTLDAVGGGRVEALAHGGFVAIPGFSSTPWEYDLPSAYPTALASGDIPGELVSYSTSERGWDVKGSIVTAIVNVSGTFPALRYRHRGRVYYPTGRFVFTGTPEELTCPGVKVERIHSVFRFEPRSEFQECAEEFIKARSETKDPHIGTWVKLLANGLIGKLGQNPITHGLSTRPVEGAQFYCPGVWLVPRFKPSRHEVLSAAATTLGRVRARIACALHYMHSAGIKPLLIDTDGGIVQGNPTGVLNGFKLTELASAEVFGAKQSISVYTDGVERVRAGGLSRNMTAIELRGRLDPYRSPGAVHGTRQSIELRRLAGWLTSNRVSMPDGSTRPYDVSELASE